MKHEYLEKMLEAEFENYKFILTSKHGVKILSGFDAKNSETIELCVLGGTLFASSSYFGDFQYNFMRNDGKITFEEIMKYSLEGLVKHVVLLEDVVHFSRKDVENYLLEGISSHDIKDDVSFEQITDYIAHFLARYFDECLGISSKYCFGDAQYMQECLSEICSWNVIEMAAGLPRIPSYEDFFFYRLLKYVDKKKLMD